MCVCVCAGRMDVCVSVWDMELHHTRTSDFFGVANDIWSGSYTCDWSAVWMCVP